MRLILDEDWKHFENFYLVETLKKDNHDLAGYGSKRDSEDYSEDENVHFGDESLEVRGLFI